MKTIQNFKNITLLSSSPYIPYNAICTNLVSHPKLKKEFESIKNKIHFSPLTTQSNDEAILMQIASFFDVKLSFKKIKNNDVSGYCWPFKRKIQIDFNEQDKEFNKRILTHELGHILQIKLGLSKDGDDIYLSEELKLEQQAEAISYYLCRILWPSHKFIKSNFNSYFKEEDIIWLDSFYSVMKGIQYINDVFILND